MYFSPRLIEVKWKISVVCHSQVPKSVTDTEVKIFRPPGGRIYYFFSDDQMNAVLEWKHDLCILWIGSNDIENDTDPDDTVNHIAETCQATARDCQAIVYVCQIEPRRCQGEVPVSHERYKKIQGGINNRLRRRLKYKVIHFNTNHFVQELQSDGMHWTDAGGKNSKGKERNQLGHSYWTSTQTSGRL